MFCTQVGGNRESLSYKKSLYGFEKKLNNYVKGVLNLIQGSQSCVSKKKILELPFPQLRLVGPVPSLLKPLDGCGQTHLSKGALPVLIRLQNKKNCVLCSNDFLSALVKYFCSIENMVKHG